MCGLLTMRSICCGKCVRNAFCHGWGFWFLWGKRQELRIKKKEIKNPSFFTDGFYFLNSSFGNLVCLTILRKVPIGRGLFPAWKGIGTIIPVSEWMKIM